MSTDRDKRLKRAEEKIYEDAKRGGFDNRRARQLAKESVEQADETKKRQGTW